MKEFKLINTISGEILECKYRYMIIELAHELIDTYKRDNIDVRLNYINNMVYEIVKY